MVDAIDRAELLRRFEGCPSVLEVIYDMPAIDVGDKGEPTLSQQLDDIAGLSDPLYNLLRRIVRELEGR